MAGATVPAADTRVALRAVASIDRLISESSDDHDLKDVLIYAAQVLRNAQIPTLGTKSTVTIIPPHTLH